MITFEWNDEKATSNERKHGLTFFEASSVFDDPVSLTISDPDHSTFDEERWITVGQSSAGRILAVVYTPVDVKNDQETIRIISARVATAAERKVYTEG